MMKAEKIEKHMLRRTVVVAQNGYNSHWDVLGVMGGSSPMSPIVYGLANGKRDHWMHQACNIRKATAVERAEFFAWLVSDGRDIADGFARFGGMPRGFEAWRAAQDAAAEPTPEPVVTPQHKVGDLRVGLDYDGLGIMGRVRQIDLDGDIWIGGACCRHDARPLFDPTPENVARLVEQQRERGVRPNAGDLVFVVRSQREVTREIGIVSWCLEGSEIKITSIAEGGDDEESCYYPRLHDCHVLVIRRCPFRGVADE